MLSQKARKAKEERNKNMKILVLNGSPKAAKSDTMVLTNSFLGGLN